MGKKLPVGHIPVSFNALAMGHPLRMYCRKLESADEDDITLHSFALTQYWRVTDGRIDRQKCCSSLHRSALLCAVIMQLWAILNSTVISHSPNLTSWFFGLLYYDQNYIMIPELYYDPANLLQIVSVTWVSVLRHDHAFNNNNWSYAACRESNIVYTVGQALQNNCHRRSISKLSTIASYRKPEMWVS